MGVKSVELYEALKPHVGRQAAEMIAEVIPPAADLARTQDILALESRLMGRLWVMFVPLWLGIWGAFTTLLVQTLRT